MKILMSLFLLMIILSAKETISKGLNTANSVIASTKRKSLSNEELRLMLNSFLYSGDVNNAYKVAKIGYKKYPNSLFWLQQTIKTAIWSNHPVEALMYKKELYHKTKKPALRDAIINESLKLYQYESIEKLVIDKFKRAPSKTNAQLVLFIEYKIGNPQKAADIFEKSYQQNKERDYLLTNLLKIYMDTGDIIAAQRIVSIMEAKELFDKVNTFLIANYYYTRHNIQKAYETLLHLQGTQIRDPLYYKAISDFGWYLNDLQNAAEAADYLVRKHEARLDDYDRVVEYYKKTKRLYSAKVAKEAYLRYHKEYFFFYYAEVMLQSGEYDALRETMETLAKTDNTLESSANYWLIKAKIENHYDNRDAAIEAISHALALAPDNVNIFQSAISSFIEMGAYKKAQSVLLAYQEQHSLNNQWDFIYASLYFQLNNIDRANYYLRKVLDSESLIKNSLEFQYLQASIHDAQGRKGLALQEYRDILKVLDENFEQNPLLKQKDANLVIYFAAALNVYDTQRFTNELQEYKKYLTVQEYANISYSLANKERAFDKGHAIYNQTKNRAVWMQLSDALLYTHYTKLEDLLHYHLQALPKQDATAAAKKDKQIALAQSLSFHAMATNRLSNSAYLAHLDLAKSRDDLFDVTTALYDRNPLAQTMLLMKNRTYLTDNFYLYAKVDLYKNSSKDEQQLFNLNSQTTVIDLGIKKEWQRLQIFMHYGYKKALVNYAQYGLLADYKLTNKLNFHANYEHSIDAEDSTYLYIGGKKDMMELRGDYAFLNSLVLDVLYQKNSFYSQDNVFLGKENYFRSALNKQFRVGYPDLGAGLFFDKGSYTKASGSYGVLAKITNETVIMPENFYNVGAEFRYGMQNADIYTRVWRPYFSVSPYYNSFSNNFDIGVSGGYGGKVYKNDHLIFGFDYSQPTNGIEDKIYKLFVNYKILY